MLSPGHCLLVRYWVLPLLAEKGASLLAPLLVVVDEAGRLQVQEKSVR